MVILFSALIFGILVMALLLFSIVKGRKAGNGKLVNILKIIVAIESMVFIALFIIVIIKTLAL